MPIPNKTKIVAWIAVIITAAFANFWAYWGVIENFHEGWYFEGFWDNIALMIGQYLSVPLCFICLGFISIKWNKIGAVLHWVLAISAYFLFKNMNAGFLLIAIPLTFVGIFYWFGKLERKTIPILIVIVLPAFQIVGIGSYLGYKVSKRYNDNNFNARLIKGNNVELIWAPKGPGWPDNGTSWTNAKNICAHLNEDGMSQNDHVRNMWRLPTIDEATRSEVYRGNNAGGTWNADTKTATYKHQPDKESPLWNAHLKTIYWWTSNELNERQAYIIVYNGGVYPRNKKIKKGYLNFRAVKNVH
jgi:hypothetical protein